VRIRFVEESPDRFHVQFVRGPKLRLIKLTIDLTGSAAGAQFDDYDGLAMQGPQPNANGVTIRSVAYRAMGKETVAVHFDGFTANAAAVLRSDLDDQGRAADPDENHIYDGELEGASAVATLTLVRGAGSGKPIEIMGLFDKKGQAVLGSRACV